MTDEQIKETHVVLRKSFCVGTVLTTISVFGMAALIGVLSTGAKK